MEISIKRIRDRHATDQWYPGSVSLNLLGGIGGRSVAQTKPMGFWKNVNSYIDVVFNCDTYIEWEDNYTDIYRDINIYFDTNCLWKIDLENSNLDDTQFGGSGLFVTIYDVSPSIHFGGYSHTDIKAGHGTIRLRASNNYTFDGFNGYLAIQHPDPGNENQLTTTYVNFFLSGIPADPGGEFYADPTNFRVPGEDYITRYANLYDALNTPYVTSKPQWITNIQIGSLSGNTHPVSFDIMGNGRGQRSGSIVFSDTSTTASIQVFQDEVLGNIKFGYLYNWFVGIDSRKLTSSDSWLIPYSYQLEELLLYGVNNGRDLKSTRTHPGDPIVGNPTTECPFWRYSSSQFGTNNLGFSAFAGGARFTGLSKGVQLTEDRGKESVAVFLSLDDYSETQSVGLVLHYLDYSKKLFHLKYSGFSIRIFRWATSTENNDLSDGDTALPYSGNDGQNYPTIYINGKIWIKENLVETKYRNGDNIPYIQFANWWSPGLDEIGVRGAYDDDMDNVFH